MTGGENLLLGAEGNNIMHENSYKTFHYIKCLLVSGTFTHFIPGANDCTLQKINYKAEIKQILTFQKSNNCIHSDVRFKVQNIIA